jgi:hypothetical protein
MTNINTFDGLASTDSADQFIFSGDKIAGIDSVKQLLDMGYEISLYDNRDNRNGRVSIRKQKGIYQIKRGGHGFSVDWRSADIKQILWTIKTLYIFNDGTEKESHGIATRNS